MRIVIVRHGETALNRSRVVQPADTPLSDFGQAQAARLAPRLAADGVAAIATSHLPRARMTAAPLEAATGLVAEPMPLLEERNFGDLRGTPYADLTEDIFAPGFAPPGGESWDAFFDRVARAWALVVARAATVDGTLVVVTHGLVCRCLAERHLQLPAGVLVPEYWHNTGVTRVATTVPHAVELLNCVAHLDEPSPTGGVSGI